MGADGCLLNMWADFYQLEDGFPLFADVNKDYKENATLQKLQLQDHNPASQRFELLNTHECMFFDHMVFPSLDFARALIRTRASPLIGTSGHIPMNG